MGVDFNWPLITLNVCKYYGYSIQDWIRELKILFDSLIMSLSTYAIQVQGVREG